MKTVQSFNLRELEKAVFNEVVNEIIVKVFLDEVSHLAPILDAKVIADFEKFFSAIQLWVDMFFGSSKEAKKFSDSLKNLRKLIN